MDIQLETRIVLQLQEIAQQTGREISDLLVEAIAEYVERNTHETAFREEVHKTLQQHHWLLEQLKER